ncbi:MAG TPA: Rnf-Nqr domain containing protein [Treponemataceae bacterium]|nr:Rnf-Nqr domain containing protein [Treponemataceae bacterium]
MNDLVKIFLTAMLIDNVVLMRFIALCPFIGMSNDARKSVGMSLAVLFVTVLATAATWPLYMFVLKPMHLEFLQILTFILVIASLVQLVEFYLKKSAPALYSSMGVYLTLITTNCAILAVTFDVIAKGYGFAQSMTYAVGVASGFTLSLLLLAGIRERIKIAPVPDFLKGTPILFVAAALLAMSFGGFAGLIK